VKRFRFSSLHARPLPRPVPALSFPFLPRPVVLSAPTPVPVLFFDGPLPSPAPARAQGCACSPRTRTCAPASRAPRRPSLNTPRLSVRPSPQNKLPLASGLRFPTVCSNCGQTERDTAELEDRALVFSPSSLSFPPSPLLPLYSVPPWLSFAIVVTMGSLGTAYVEHHFVDRLKAITMSPSLASPSASAQHYRPAGRRAPTPLRAGASSSSTITHAPPHGKTRGPRCC